MIKRIIEDLRSLAQRCMSFARDTEEGDLSLAMQEFGIFLAEKASELEKKKFDP